MPAIDSKGPAPFSEDPRAFPTLLRRAPVWIYRDIVAPVVVSRLLLVLVAWLGFQLVEKRVLPNIGAWEITTDAGRLHLIGDHVTPGAHPFLNMWSRWDSIWYMEIAKNGYSFEPHRPSNAAFYPLYPMGMRLVHRFIKMKHEAGWMLAGIILSNIAFVAALFYLYRLIRMDFDDTIAARAILYLTIFPTTLFFSAVYSESLFLLVVVSAFYYARKQQWLVAGLLGAAGALNRSPGFLLVLPLACEYLAQRNFRWREIKLDILSLALIPLALFAHLAYLHSRYGAWDVIQQAQGNFGRGFSLLPVTLWKYLADQYPLTPLNLANIDFVFLVCGFLLLAYGAFRLRPSYTVYVLVSILFVSTWGFPVSMGRYELVMFPLFIALALLGRSDMFNRLYLILSAGLAAFFMLLFSQWGWVA